MVNTSVFRTVLILVFIALAVSIPLKGIREKKNPFKLDGFQDGVKRSVESEEKVNEHEDVDLFEGDIVLTDNDKELVDLRDAGDVDGPLDIDKRNAMRNRYNLWNTRVVPYVIDSSLGASAINAINQAIYNYQQYTCIQWRPRTGSEHYVKFIKKSGCWSYVGRVLFSVGYQELSIGPGCEYVGTVMHEMMHAVGFWHAQSRPDRNQVVEIMWENIQEGHEHNFNKYNHDQTDVLGLPYDIDSIMHYGKTYFSKNGQNTIQKIGDPNASFGQRNGFSNNDKLQLNKLYSCNNPSGGWSDWSSYAPCDSSCKKSRMRFCTNENPAACDSSYSYGVQSQTADCSNEECNKPVDGHWGRWATWGACSKTCDIGVHSRTRLCDDPTPKNSGAACVGESTQSQNCRTIGCNNVGPDDCEFDNPSKPFCNWTQDSSDNHTNYPNWVRRSGQTPSVDTGPQGDHTLGTGYYIHGEASSCNAGKVVRLLSKDFPSTSGRCMSFWYNMYGATMGTFNIYIKPNSGSLKKIFTRSGNQGNAWISGNASIESSDTYKVVLEMVCGSSWQSDVAVDDITFKNSACSASA